MGWGYGELDGREVGYAVDATCDAEGCDQRIDRGLAYRCGGDLDGCGRYLCLDHLDGGPCEHEDSWEDEPAPGRILARHLLCDEVAVANANAGVAMCDREHGHEGSHMPHPSFWDAV